MRVCLNADREILGLPNHLRAVVVLKTELIRNSYRSFGLPAPAFQRESGHHHEHRAGYLARTVAVFVTVRHPVDEYCSGNRGLGGFATPMHFAPVQNRPGSPSYLDGFRSSPSSSKPEVMLEASR